jgi:acyl carrier protein
MVKDKKLKKNNKHKKSTMTMRSDKMKVVRDMTNDTYSSMTSVISSDDAAIRERIIKVLKDENFQKYFVNDEVFTIEPENPLTYPDLVLTELIIALENEFNIRINDYSNLCPKIMEGGGCTFTVDDIIKLVQ